ncbi:alpha/beta fold hydrolase [soil metagenome]
MNEPASATSFDAWKVELHGHEVIYRTVGDGPPVVLVHGMLNSSLHFKKVAMRLAERHTVIVPDLIGHGDSATPRGDYSIGAHAAVIRDLLSAIGVERASIVGHSLGGGIAMQYFWQFPERVERLALISAGGLGRDVGLPLRLAALPGASVALWLASNPRTLGAIETAASKMDERGSQKSLYLRQVVRALRPLERPGARQAFLQTLRSVIDPGGQHVSARDRLYLLGPVPTLIVWGERDGMIPIEHGREAAAQIPHSRFESIPAAGHFPHLDSPDALSDVLLDWLATTDARHLDSEEWAELISSRTVRSRHHLRAA